MVEPFGPRAQLTLVDTLSSVARSIRGRILAGLATLLAAAALPGCVSNSSPPRYDYDLAVQNACDRPVSLEILYVDNPGVGHVGADLAPGGRYSTTFSTQRRLDYTEARLRFLDAAPDPAGPFFIYRMSRERALYIVSREGDALRMAPRPLPDPRDP